MAMVHDTHLFPDSATRRTAFQRLTDALQSSRATMSERPVSPTVDLADFRKDLDGFDFGSPRGLETTIQWVVDRLSDGSVQMTHPRYFGLFNPAPTFPSECADVIASSFNPQLAVWSHAPVAVEIERHTVRLLADRLGFASSSTGHFTSGGSEANRTAMVSALTRCEASFANEGARAFTGQPTLYVSRESHLAWLKIAHEVGIGRQAVRLIATDGHGRMDMQALRETIEQDLREGCVPTMIAATAGTTNAGVVDPMRACASIARTFNLWLHTDAAWGGALIASDRFRSVLEGIELSDSVTIDAHKWFATTMGAGMFFTQHADILSRAFHVDTDYMPSNDRSVDWYVTSSQWSRRFIGLRLFLSLAVAGWEGYAQHVESAVELTDRLSGKLRQRSWRVVNDSRMAVVCFVPPDDATPVAEIAERVVGEGAHWISITRFEGEPVLRACITNGNTGEDDIDALVESLESARRV